jgi:hypothetical protein
MAKTIQVTKKKVAKKVVDEVKTVGKMEVEVAPVEGRAKSGRVWKTKQSAPNRSQKMKGVVAHMAGSLEKRNKEKARRNAIRAVETQMKEQKAEERRIEKERVDEKAKRRAQNEFKNTKFQVVNAQKLKTMSKKQLRMVKKTRMAANGALELVGAYD